MGKLWAFYAIGIFFLLSIILYPFYLLAFLTFPLAWRKHIFWFNHHFLAPFFLFLIGIRVKVTGKEHIDRNKTYIIVSNHLSLIDFFINAVAYPGIYKYLAKKELVNIPLFGYVVRKNCVLVDRSSSASRAASLKYLRSTLDEGYAVFLYPEGSRNKTGELLLPFHKGAFRIAIESGNPVAAQTLVGMDEVAGRGNTLELRSGVVHVKWAEPISVLNLTMNDVDMLSSKVREIMLENLRK